MIRARPSVMTTSRQRILVEGLEEAAAEQKSITTIIDQTRLPMVEIVEESSNTIIIALIVVETVAQPRVNIMLDAVLQEEGLALLRQVVDVAAKEVLQRRLSRNPVAALLESFHPEATAATCTVEVDPAPAESITFSTRLPIPRPAREEAAASEAATRQGASSGAIDPCPQESPLAGVVRERPRQIPRTGQLGGATIIGRKISALRDQHQDESSINSRSLSWRSVS